MKKLCLLSITVLLAFAMVACEGFIPIPGASNEVESVQYSADGGSVTINLEGGGPTRSLSRALTDALAKRGHDYFEVVFYDGATTTVARASWELGQAAGITNVSRAAPGVDYDDATKAVLFVGRKSDKTLLAIGLLTHVDGTSGTTITTSTKTVTFTVSALKGGATLAPAATDTFLVANTSPDYDTPNLAGTQITEVEYYGLKFPLYNLDADVVSIAAQYTLDCTDAAGIDAYIAGVKIANGTGDVELRLPRVSMGGDSLDLPVTSATKTEATLAAANLTADGSFANPIAITFDTTDDAGVCAFTFNIPVYAITTAAGVSSSTPASTTWFIRPGFGTNRYDLDDGKGSAGGSILLGIGSESNWIKIITTSKVP